MSKVLYHNSNSSCMLKVDCYRRYDKDGDYGHLPIGPIQWFRPSSLSLRLIHKRGELLWRYLLRYRITHLNLVVLWLRGIEAKDKMKYIENHICACSLFPTICMRKSHMISIHSAILNIICAWLDLKCRFLATFPGHPIQIILRLYRSPAEILAGFDIDLGFGVHWQNLFALQCT